MALTPERLEYHRKWRANNPEKVSEAFKRWHEKSGKGRYYENLELTRAIKRKCYYVSVGQHIRADQEQQLIDKLREEFPAKKAGPKVKFVGEDKVSRRREAARKYRYRHVEGIPSYHAPDKCQLCGGGGKICMDHCHQSSKFRGWLCDDCNIVIGRAKESPELLEQMAKYLREFRSNQGE